MKKYLVGGAVRDMIMGIEPNDRDWVIVGATQADIQKMVSDGYEQVGADFPVFLHPKTKEEYALARIERKTGVGYQGFECDTENVTLEQDLQRRDLTMNAIAYDPETKQFIDPFNGRKDIIAKTIRHVSDAFKEDPVRVLRAARFAARFGFNVAEETVKFMCQMKDAGELNHLQPNRVMQELVKTAETAIQPSKFIKVIRNCNAWPVLFTEVEPLTSDELEQLDKAVNTASNEDRFPMFMAIMLHKTSESQLEAMQARIVVPSKAYRFAKRVALYSTDYADCLNKQPEEIVTLFMNMNIHNNGGEVFLQRISDSLFARGMMTRDVDEQILRLYDLYSSVDIEAEIAYQKTQGVTLKGIQIRDRLREMRIESISRYFQ